MIGSLKLLIICTLLLHVNCAVKSWINGGPVNPWPTPSANKECANSKAIFSKHIDGLLYMNDQQRFNELVLPSDGAIVLSSNSEIQFSDTQKCSADETAESPLLDSSKHLWFSTSSWSSKDESSNVAKPHIFQIPCECDIVEFPNEFSTSVDLEYVDEIVVDKILINGRTDDFEGFLETKIGQKMFLNSEAVRFVQGFCNPPKYCGCHNHKRFVEYSELLCSQESKYCEEPHCLEPIQPKGHCCPMCGAILNFKIKDTCEFNMTNIKEVGRKLNRFRNGKYINKINFYAGMVPGKKRDDNLVQLVIAEVGEYTGISVEFINFLTKDKNFKEDFYRIKTVAGIPFIRGKSSTLLIMGLTLLFVLSLFSILYVHYIHEPKYETWVPIERLNVLRRSVAFARFENRHTDDDDINTIDVGVRYDDDGNISEQNVTDFNNPLYETEQVTTGSIDTVILEANTSKSNENALSTDINLVDISLNGANKDE